MKVTLLSILLFALTPLCCAADVHFEHSYSWGSVSLSAGSSDSTRPGGKSLLVVTNNVLADFRLSGGDRFLVATGRLEIDPATGEFYATNWPYICSIHAGEKSRYFAINDEVSVRSRGDKVVIKGPHTSTIFDESGTPDIRQIRLGQLARLEKRL